jgi:hypothetical protein
MIKIINGEYQQFRKDCLDNLNKEITIEYEGNTLIHTFEDSIAHPMKVESEIANIYQVMTKGAIPFTNGIDSYLDIDHGYKVNYRGDDIMIGLKNIKMTTQGRHTYTTTYMITCEECGRTTFHSVKSDNLPKCRCASEHHLAPQVKAEELIDMCDYVDLQDNIVHLKGQGVSIELKLDQAQLETMGKVASDDVREKLKTLFHISNNSIDINKPAEEPRPASVPMPKSTTTRKAKSKISEDDFAYILEAIQMNFGAKSFKNKDLAPFVAEQFSARQLPSRLTQMVNRGILTATNTSPKSYNLVDNA